MKPLVSVIIVSYNKPDYLEQAIKSVFSSSMNIPSEVMVIDDASSQGTLKKLKHLNTLYDFKLIINEQNLGPSACRNKGIALARAKYIAFLDGDDYWLDARLDKTLQPLLHDPNLDLVFSDALMEIEGELTHNRQSELMSVPSTPARLLEHLFKRNFINMCAVTMKATLAKKVNFDESLRSAEDYDFWLRTAAQTNRYLFIDEPLVVYRLHGNNLSSRRLLSIDSALKVLEKNENFAKSTLAKDNLVYHRQSLLEDRLKVNEADLGETLRKIKKLRPLGKREIIVNTASNIHHSVGRLARRALIK